MMSGIRGKNTRPELLVRKMLFASGYRFRIHWKHLPGAPDVVLPGRKIAIFVHGCFWHMHAHCKHAKIPSSRPEFWKAKLSANVERDQKAVDTLTATGWRVLIVWECSMRNVDAMPELRESIVKWIEGSATSGSISGPIFN